VLPGWRLEHGFVRVPRHVEAVPLTQLYSLAYASGMAERSDVLGEALYALAAGAIRRRNRTLSLTTASTLATLERTGPRRLTDLAVTEEVTQPSMTVLVTQLEHLGLAERRRDPADARVVLVAITRAGRRHLREMRRAGASALTGLVDKLSEQEVDALSAALPVLRHLVDLGAESQDSQTGFDPPSVDVR
jgi:DNA-binding MarR family transcriptional regulator